MKLKQLSITAAVSALTLSTATNAVLGPIPIYLNPIKVDANHFNDLDTNATFSTEIYSSKDIDNSGSTNLYDFLSNNTSITITPSSGNRFSQKIDMRGYGTTNGHQNIIITVDGIRLNNHTSSQQTIGNIILNNIDKIEITKGSGSVVYGDGAMSGAIHIFMKDAYDSYIELETGNYGLSNKSISTSSQSDGLSVNASFEAQEKGGYAIADNTGNKDWGKQTNKAINLNLKATNNTQIQLSLAANNSDYRYAEYQTISQFNANPSQNGTGRNYAHSVVNSNEYSLGLNTNINSTLSLKVTSTDEEKSSETVFYWGSGGIKKDKKTSDSITLKYANNNITINSGYSKLYGERKGKSWGSSSFDKLTTKDNEGYFIQAKQLVNDTTYVAGFRDEKVGYFYNKTSATGNHNLTAYNFGINKKIDGNLSMFSNYNKAFQAYDINTAFKYDSGIGDSIFDGFIKPMTSKTLNVGLDYTNQNSKTKLTLFRSNLNNEIYLHKQNSSDLGTNANLDKSHKIGIEIDTKHIINPKATIGINYSYIDAIIDFENETEDRGDFNGKSLPGVSKNTLAANVKFKLDNKSTLTLKHKYRDEAYAEEDFSNTNTEKTKAFNATDLNYAYSHSKDIKLSLDIENLFKKQHATLLGDYNSTGGNVVYPASYTRNIKLGLTYKF
ncbi:MAG: TonB-dependent receptor [Candidatus Thioglobus sp.]|nr:TonB-dependent receptor [Candidatus Thioglobus sp.]